MLINGIDLSTLGVELYDRVIYSNSIDTAEEWLDGDIQPTFIRQQDNFKTLKLDFLVLCQEEEDAFLRISRLTALLKKATIKFDDMSLTFDVSIIDVGEPNRLKNGNFIVSYTLSSGYAKGQREVYTTNANATNSFKLTVVYYKDQNTMISTDTVSIRASMFDKDNVSLADLGIDVNKYQPDYYNAGIATNLVGMELNFANLQQLQILIINYAPANYNLQVNYFMNNGNGEYSEILQRNVVFTQPQLQHLQTIGQLVGIADYKPEGYKGTCTYKGQLTVENILQASPIYVYYDKIETPQSKNVLVTYKAENDEGEYDIIQTTLLNINETTLYDGSVLGDIINIEGYRPNATYYNSGYIDGHQSNELITYDALETAYSVIYTKATNTLYVEYYAGTYPNWYRLTTATITTKYKASYENEFNLIEDLGIDLNKYKTAQYNDGQLYNQSSFTTYEAALNAGVLQVYYTPIDYPIVINYYTQGLNSEPIVETTHINALMFFNNPLLSDVIPIMEHRPEGYQFDQDFSYNGEVTLEALTLASPIRVVYSEIQAARTKNVIIRYKQELSSAYSTITTALVTISEADIVGGTRLKDIINLNLYKPEYYEDGIVDGASSTAIIQYDDIASEYNVLYLAATYNTPVRYYVDEVDDLHWIGSSVLQYRVIDFSAGITLYDFGLDLNMFKPSYTGNGELLYTGPVNFTSLMEAESINVLYTTETAPGEDDDIDYPHRFLFLQHNDLGSYENLHPEWTMNHAFINTGISAADVSKLTVVMECDRVDPHVPLYEVNAGYGYLFGSTGPLGAYYMRYNNQTMYGEGLTGVNTYEAKAGNLSNVLTLTEDAAVGFSENSGIYSSAQQGYSRAVFTYSNVLPTDGAPMNYPLYLFANNFAGSYANGIAGVGIYSCRIYYEDKLVRDFIPVEFYDKIGDLVAPSNCLYDKITKTFFEDGSGHNSFNIRDDDRFVDTNLEHKIGHCYVNYYKGDQFIKTMAVYFRGNEFADGKFDLYERFRIDENQPQYCRPGEIKDITNIQVTFDGLNNQIFTVNYEPIETRITVNYYREDDGVQTLIKTEEIALTENDFYQVPTFGDIVRINKYKPEGYETDFTYTGSKVSLSRVLAASPYNIVYKPIQGEIETYTTKIIFIKKVFGVRKYETIATKILTFDQSNFRDGEYIDFYIDFNECKPEKYYKNGATYQWYEMDERLTNPENLKETYTIVYTPEKQFVDINYYTDEVDEANLVASDSWGLYIDDLDPSFKYSIVDILPNEYINKYKPVTCNGGQIQNPDMQFNFDSLIQYGHIDIVYEHLYEPDDPTEAHYEKKVIGFGQFDIHQQWNAKEESAIVGQSGSILNHGGVIPYIDLGYRPKEIGRLKVEIKSVVQPNGFVTDKVVKGGLQDTSYGAYFGYVCPTDIRLLGDVYGTVRDQLLKEEDLGNFYSTYIDNTKKGHFTFKPRYPEVSNWVYTAEGPQSMDGYDFYTAASGVGAIANPDIPWTKFGQNTSFRRGASKVLDENWEPIINCYEYGKEEERKFDTKKDNWVLNYDRNVPAFGSTYPDYLAFGGKKWVGDNGLKQNTSVIANPITTTLDAYNGYWTSYTEEDSNSAPYEFINNKDLNLFEARLQPKGTLTLFRTRNPITGEINIMPTNVVTYPSTQGPGTPTILQGGNPYLGGGYKTTSYEVLVSTGATNADGTLVYQVKTESRNVRYAQFPIPVYPQINAAAIWSVKIWDQDRLVRDLIPVEKGDKIYDYIMPENGMFDLVTEIFFGNANKGGTYSVSTYFELDASDQVENGPAFSKDTKTVTINPYSEDSMRDDPFNTVYPFWVTKDPTQYGLITMNYYDYDYSFIANQFVSIPTWYSLNNTTFEEIVGFNDYKPDDFHLNGMLDIDDPDSPLHTPTLKEIYEMGSANVYYKLKTFTKTVVYYQDNYRIGSKDIFYSLEDIKNANTLDDLGIDLDLYQTEDFKHGRLVFNEDIIASDDMKAFIDAPSPIVVYDKYTKEERPNLLYVEYYRGGAYDDGLIVHDPNDENYFDCELDGVVLNPNGAIKYFNHYHQALYEDEVFDYFAPYQVKVINKYAGIHRGPARKFPTLATIVTKEVLTIIEERNGWGRVKEYPVGWIMLNATQPMTGPGQNPEYDTPDDKAATIPFGTEVTISKLTVDRLWCYVPAVESWVKAEDISYNQSGKLYNALYLDVIHLDNIDFSTAASLNDIGIYPQKRKLYFHDNSNYSYDGEYTYEAFSNLHEIEIVYPETIYNYSCIYYKDNKSDGGEQEKVLTDPEATGTVRLNGGKTYYLYYNPDRSFGFEMCDFYLSKTTTVPLLSLPKYDDDGEEWRKVRYLKHEGWINISSDVTVTEELPYETVTIESNELGRSAFSCCISDWNPDWDVFIETSWKTDNDGNDINPTLYRDVPLSLTWDYFGFDKNLYQPSGYSEGIYLWNPRSWESDGNVHFTFEELIRCGTQYVVYPCIDPNVYKIWVYNNLIKTGSSTQNTTGGAYDTYTTYYFNPGISIDLSTSNAKRFSNSEGVIDVNLEYELPPISRTEFPSLKTYTWYDHQGRTYNIYYSEENTTPTKIWRIQDSNISNTGENKTHNYSNFRDKLPYVYGLGNIQTGQPYNFYIRKSGGGSSDVKIEYNTKLQSNITIGQLMNSPVTLQGGEFPILDNELAMKGIIYKIQSFQSFSLVHYWIPVPKGLHYTYNGIKRRIPDNGLLDIMTNEFRRCYKAGEMTDYGRSSEKEVDGLSYIFLKTQQPDIKNAFDYFNGWSFNSTDIDYIVKINKASVKAYAQPDIYTQLKRTMPSTAGLIVPVSKVTSDVENNVAGEWYFSGDEWFQSNKAEIFAGNFDKLRLEKHAQRISFVKPVETQTYYGYLNPAEVDEPGVTTSSFTFNSNNPYAFNTYYTYTDTNDNKYYFDGRIWIPEQYTSLNINESNKNYVIVPDQLTYYEFPIENDSYAAGRYHYGERITVLYTAGQDEKWGYTGLGWIRVTDTTVSEVL